MEPSYANIDAFAVATENLPKAYHRLLLVVGPHPPEISRCIAALANRLDRPIINLNFALSTALLDVPRRQRPLKAHKLLGVSSTAAQMISCCSTTRIFCSARRCDWTP